MKRNIMFSMVSGLCFGTGLSALGAPIVDQVGIVLIVAAFLFWRAR